MGPHLPRAPPGLSTGNDSIPMLPRVLEVPNPSTMVGVAGAEGFS